MVRAAWACLAAIALGSCSGPEPKPSPAPPVPASVASLAPPIPKAPELPPEPAPAKLSHPFEEGGVSLYELALPAEEWRALIELPTDNRWHRCSLSWCGERYDDVGIRASGQVTRISGCPKPSLRVSFKKFGK